MLIRIGFVMENSIIMLIVLSLLLGVGCWLVFVWAVKRGEFDDTERPKYRMLDDEEEGNDDSTTWDGSRLTQCSGWRPASSALPSIYLP